MSVRRLDPQQPSGFAFTKENLEWAKATIAKYPDGKQRSAVIALLWRAQEQHEGWLSEPAIRYVADMLGMAQVRVLEVATFYTMFQLSPVGTKAHVQVCGTTPCMLRGSEQLIEVCKRRIAHDPHNLSADGDFSWEEVECLGACVNAPLVQVGTDLYEDLTPATFESVLDAFARGEHPQPGPRIDRQFSAPVGGPTTLTTPGLYDVGGAGASAAASAADAPGRAAADVAGDTFNRQLDVATAAVRATGDAVHGASSGGAATGVPASSGASNAAAGGGVAQAAVSAANLTPGVKVTDAGDDGAGAPVVAAKPAALAGPRDGKADDLKRISGVGPKLEGVLNGLGIYHFDQIASWTPGTVAWVDDFLSFKGRIEREDWISQAKKLKEG